MSFLAQHIDEGEEIIDMSDLSLTVATPNNSLRILSTPVKKAEVLHGRLVIRIKEGKNFPNMDTSVFTKKSDVSDPYVQVFTCINGVNQVELLRTCTIQNDLNPKWNENFELDICHALDSFFFLVMDHDVFSKDDKIGHVHLPATEFFSKNVFVVNDWFPLTGGPLGSNSGMIQFSIEFQAAHSQEKSQANSCILEIPRIMYPMRENCLIKLYQNAHSKNNDTDSSSPSLWEDMWKYMKETKYLIYIVGRNINPQLKLVRNTNNEVELGELLKQKAFDGVKVVLMIYDDRINSNALSSKKLSFKDVSTKDTSNYSTTYDTNEYFKGSKVEVVKCKRNKRKNPVEKIFIPTGFMHDQTYVILDAKLDNQTAQDSKKEKRKLVAFQGSINLMTGQWDTSEHCLYETLFSTHSQDFYNPIFSTSSTVGPRLPCHHVHMYLEGEIVLDLVANFLQRWRKEMINSYKNECDYLASLSNDDFNIHHLHDLQESSQEGESANNYWNAQLLRSINSDSIMLDDACKAHVHHSCHAYYDNSIHQAFVYNIRNATKFIYLEFESFIGSSYAWLTPYVKEFSNLVPIEIVQRISRAIDLAQEFRVYILLPLHPEGDPTSASIQEILQWQFRTMEMMYEKITTHLLKTNSNPSNKATDYLSFFTLGKREHATNLPPKLNPCTSNNSIVAKKVREKMSLLIQVKSKLAIFDDEYIIIGSANINERSLNGNRDTELCIGATHSTAIQTFRQSLWKSHTGSSDFSTLSPQSLDCMKTLRELGEVNLKRYKDGNSDDSQSKLMLYPLKVWDDGVLTDREDFSSFPCTGGAVRGKRGLVPPAKITS